ncbi:hypothetical protein O3G_MSEX003602 [Manduca sexta]|uniref:Sperm microtubule inner protein 1 C-terminal domain-containing protein n=1 Tax=Manduca sexta TaxID=7130 RepID=A0A921YUK9_MANSE|nr:hypothetical protein O3G_MSEX003602 [Manduca sexta]
MPLDYSNPEVLKFLVENFVKENEKRVSWFMRNKVKIIDAAKFKEDYKVYRVEDINRALIELPLPALSCQHAENLCNRRLKPLRDGPILGTNTTINRALKHREIPEEMIMELLSDAVMKPVEQDITKILFEGIPYGGRREYLKARCRKLSKERFYLDQTTNHEIGWQVNEATEIDGTLRHGRHCTLMRELNNRTGPQPDPRYYQLPLLNPYIKCFNT